MESSRRAAIELPEDVYMDEEETVDPNDVATLRAALAASNAALEEERRWRTEQEMAVTEALDQVRSRSIVLQQRLEGAWPTSTSVPGDPQKLQDYTIGVGLGPLESEASPSDDNHSTFSWLAEAMRSTGPADAMSQPEGTDEHQPAEDLELDNPWLGATLLSRAAHAQSFTPASSLGVRKRSDDADRDDDDSTQLAQLSSRAQLSSARANAACNVLQRLLTRVGSSADVTPAGRLMPAVERDVAWIEGCELKLSACIDQLLDREATADLRELRLHKQIRDAKSAAADVNDVERSRAERAERRCRQLVGALRTSNRSVVDEAEAVSTPTRFYRPTADIDAVRNARWERQRSTERTTVTRGAQATHARRQAVLNQLLMPTMPASQVAGGRGTNVI